jgi:hypothetical protein
MYHDNYTLGCLKEIVRELDERITKLEKLKRKNGK